ncbi:DsbA family oxidoreductase [Labilithrix luteola]|nr:DsbA family oxidoreductase [Labilithrix luteola]
MTDVSIDIVSDIVCPWCFIGSRRVEQALEGLDVRAKVAFHPFLLDPSLPAEGVDLRERLAKRYNVDPDRMFGRVEEAARQSGIPLDFAKVRRMPSTVKGHTLVRHAEALGTQPALARALFAAYFLEGRDIGDTTTLADIAEQHGFTRDAALALLSNDAELEETKAIARSFSERGITGVPFVIVNDKVAINGAQPVEIFQQAITRAATMNA